MNLPSKVQEDKIIARKVRAAEDKRIKEYLKMLKEKEAKKLEKKLKKEAKKEAKKKKTRS